MLLQRRKETVRTEELHDQKNRKILHKKQINECINRKEEKKNSKEGERERADHDSCWQIIFFHNVT